jgi:hypothetical protein
MHNTQLIRDLLNDTLVTLTPAEREAHRELALLAERWRKRSSERAWCKKVLKQKPWWPFT